MRTTLNLDDEIVSAAMRVSPGMTKTAVIEEALRWYARRRALAGFADLRGEVEWEGNLDELRGRVPTGEHGQASAAGGRAPVRASPRAR